MTRLRLPSYFTLLRVRMPDAATVPNRTIPAPPRTAVGTAATTRPRTGSRPRITRIAPPAVTTKRLLTPVMATSPTFCAKALWVKVLRNGAMMLEAMSARRPSAMRRESTFVPAISPTARMSAVVSVRITRTTITMEMMPPSSKTGQPKANGCGKAKIAPWPTLEKSAMPSSRASTVPSTIARRMESREIAAFPSLESSNAIRSVAPASPMFCRLP